MKKIFLLVFLFFQNLYSDEYGVFMVVKGKVRIENAQASTEAKVNSKIQVGDTVVTENDSRAKIVMSDRNIINVSPNTKLKIEKYTNTESDKNVNLNLIEGKVRNDVEQKYDNKNSKFEVRTATAVAGVRGTQFITSYDKTTKTTEVVTLRGKVTFQSTTIGGKESSVQPVIVDKGERSQVNEDSQPAPPVKIPEKEIRQIERETSVKRKQRDEGGANNAPPSSGRPGDTGPLPQTGTPLIDLNSGNTQIIDGEATRKYDKSKVRIITQPSN